MIPIAVTVVLLVALLGKKYSRTAFAVFVHRQIEESSLMLVSVGCLIVWHITQRGFHGPALKKKNKKQKSKQLIAELKLSG